ncbi:hypothetical protein (plasmid) [Enterococcus faecium]|nr:hypothetical protein [Enterococcus faecium]
MSTNENNTKLNEIKFPRVFLALGFLFKKCVKSRYEHEKEEYQVDHLKNWDVAMFRSRSISCNYSGLYLLPNSTNTKLL